MNNINEKSSGQCHRNLTDLQLLSLCRQYGANAVLWKRKFMGLLPEVARRRLYESKNCSSIFEFAAKYGGVSKENVQRILCVNETFEKRGNTTLLSLLQRGEVSVCKLARVASIATQENENSVVNAVKNLPQTSLETYVRDMKIEMKLQDNFDILRSDVLLKSVRSHGITPSASQEQANLTFGDMGVADGGNGGVGEGCVEGGEVGEIKNLGRTRGDSGAGEFEVLKLELAPDIVEQLQYLKSCGIDINQFIRESLEQRKNEIQQTKRKVAEKVIEKESQKRTVGKEISRYVPMDVRKTLSREFGTKCAIPECTHDSDHLHHTARFSLGASHNPYYMAPLCKEHHDIAHLVDENFARMKNRGVGDG